jgi:hypothetical protein
MYANIEKIEVVANTPKSLIFLVLSSGSSTANIEKPLITSKLKAADPTIVEGPSSPPGYPKVCKVSITDSNISGADDPRAMRDRFARVAFQTGTS